MEQVRTRLVRDTDGAGLAGWRLEATWTRRVSGGSGTPTPPPPPEPPPTGVPARSSAVSDGFGDVALDVPEPSERIGDVRYRVSTPEGERVAERDDRPPSTWSLTAPATPPVAPVDPAIARPQTIRGRVLDSRGRSAPAGTALTLFGRAPDGAGGMGPVTVLVQLVTSAGGYFRTERPAAVLARAFARVGGVDASALPLDADGRIASRVIVVSAGAFDGAGGAGGAGCACDESAPRTPDPDDLGLAPDRFSSDLGGRCVDMTTPNRVLDEITYFKVVRVSEPDVEGISTTPTRLDRATQALLQTLVVGTARTTATSGTAGATFEPRDPNFATRASAAGTELHADIAARAFSHPDRLTAATLDAARFDSRVADLDADLRATAQGSAGRVPMDSAHAVDWDASPTVYQAVTVAHGHLLTYRQVWRADGYSLGDLLYSLPLAPGQKKLISVLDWTRSEDTIREEWTTEEEELHAFLERDRDVVEIVDSHLRETSSGGSRVNTWGGGGGVGFGAIGTGFGIFAGVAGGAGGSSGNSWQDSGRNFAADSMQSIRDGTMQGASVVRSSRSSVIQTDHQAERSTAVTEVVVNYNHCHALTVEYFEVLRHFTLSHELADVQECLFIPLPARWFDRAKALRWREPLVRFLRERALVDAFAAAERVQADWQGYDTPERSYAEEAPEVLEGELWVSFVIPRPRDAEDGKYQVAEWKKLAPYLKTAPLELWTSKLNQRTAAERDLIFRRDVAPGIAGEIVQRLRFAYVTTDGSVVNVPLDATLVGRYAEGVPLYVTLRPAGPLPNVPREDIARFRIALEGAEFPEDAQVVVRRGMLRYDSAHLQHLLFDEGRILDDLALGDEVLVPTPLAPRELENPRNKDRELVARLVKHLDDNLEYYHQLLWMTMDPARRFLLLDGFLAPNANGRSLASVVENRVLGIVGNCLVMPVAPGNVLAPPLRDERGAIVPLMEHYAVPPAPPIRITVPTRGVFAEAIQGACNSCETVDDTRLWRFDESPIPDSPAPIEAVGLESRAETPVETTPTAGPPPIINIQAPPALPDPMGLSGVFGLLAKSNLFKDVTGLAANQQAALGAYQAALDTAKAFAGHASAAVLQQDLAKNIGRTLDQAAAARESGLLTQEQASAVAYQALSNLVGAEAPKDAHPLETPAVDEAIHRAADSPSGQVTVESPGERVDVAYSGGEGDQDVVIGASPVPSTREIEQFVKMPLYVDDSSATLTSPDVLDTVGEVESHYWPGHSRVALDETWARAENFGWMRRKPGAPSVLEVNVRYQITIPARSATAKSPLKKKCPLVVFLHGNHERFSTNLLRIPPSYRGYTPIQEHLARLGIASISVDDNVCNWLNLFVEMRARHVTAAVQHLRRLTRTRGHALENAIDFDEVVFVGHSRGGEAVVRAALLNSDTTVVPTSQKVRLRAVCTIAPTDFKGRTGDPIARPLEESDTEFFLGLYGTHDGDVDGEGGAPAFGGTSFRHYDRSRCPKAHVYIDFASHNRFNTVWVDPSYAGSDELEILLADRPRLLAQPSHSAIASEFIGALARWKFFRAHGEAQLLDGRRTNTVTPAVSMLHQFSGDVPIGFMPVNVPVPVRVTDSFTNDTTNDTPATRTIASAEGVSVVATDTNDPIGTFAKPALILNDTKALFIPLDAQIVAATPRLSTPVGSGGASADVSAFTALEFDMAVLGNVTDATTTSAIPLPRLSVELTDAGPSTTVLADTFVFAHRKPKRPTFRRVATKREADGTETTKPLTYYRLETMRVALSLFTANDLTRVTSVQIAGDGSNDAEILIDNVRFVREVS